jgi:hypothetical protein
LAAIEELRRYLDNEFAAALERARKVDPFPVVRLIPEGDDVAIAIYRRSEFQQVIGKRENNPECWDLLISNNHPPGTVFFVLIHGHEHSWTRTVLVPKGPKDLDAIEAKLKADEEKFASWAKKTQEEYKRRREDIDARKKALQDERHRRRLALVLGVKDGVKIHFRAPAGQSDAVLNDRLETLLAINRTRADVDFGEVNGDARPWLIPLDNLIPAEQPQGQVVPL